MMTRRFWVYVCVFSVVSSVLCTLTPVVNTRYGKLRGLRSISGQNLYYGIPYASCTRYQAPREPASWSGTFYAVRRFGACAQTISIAKLGVEDCLNLDLYAPETAQAGDRLPVFMFLHGGAYYYGSKLHYDPEFLVTKNVIGVIINYRLGAFGFLCMNGTANLGLKDQVAALKWIKRNIAAFGGDPDNVTIVGQSAGASAAGMHLLSESSKGLFHKLILLSGSPLAPWAFNSEPLSPAFEDARKMTKVSENADVYNFFANATLNDLLTVSQDTSINPRYFKYSPCDDSNFTDPFFRDTPYNIIKSGKFYKVPIITGMTSVEGLLFYGLNDDKTLKELDEDFIERLPSVFTWCSNNDRQEIAEKLRDHYFGSKPIRKSLVGNVISFYTDWISGSTADAFVDLMVKYSDKPVYRYMFNYEGDRNFAKYVFGQGIKVQGPTHSDDLFYMFKPAGLSLILSSRDIFFIDRLTKMVTNFMKFGDPTPVKSRLLPLQWPAVSTTDSLVSMRLDLPFAIIRPEPRDQFYYRLLCAYGLPGFVPCDSQMMCNRDTK